MKMSHKDFNLPENLSVSELQKIRSDLDAHIAQRREDEKQATVQKIKSLVIESGFNVEEILPLLTDRKEHPVRYRHPHDSRLTWCGKGRRPLWMTDALREGITIEEMAA